MKVIQANMQPNSDKKDDEAVIEEFAVDIEESVDFPFIHKEAFDIKAVSLPRCYVEGCECSRNLNSLLLHECTRLQHVLPWGLGLPCWHNHEYMYM